MHATNVSGCWHICTLRARDRFGFSMLDLKLIADSYGSTFSLDVRHVLGWTSLITYKISTTNFKIRTSMPGKCPCQDFFFRFVIVLIPSSELVVLLLVARKTLAIKSLKSSKSIIFTKRYNFRSFWGKTSRNSCS